MAESDPLLNSSGRNILSWSEWFPVLLWEVTMFEVDRFVDDCRAAFAAESTYKAIREVLARAMSEPRRSSEGSVSPSALKSASSSIRILLQSSMLCRRHESWSC